MYVIGLFYFDSVQKSHGLYIFLICTLIIGRDIAKSARPISAKPTVHHGCMSGRVTKLETRQLSLMHARLWR